MSGKFLLKVILSLGAVLIILTITAMEYTSRPVFCESCHEMRPMYQTWRQSGHKEVHCLRCHSDPGLPALVRTKINGLEQVYLHFTDGYRRPITITSDTPQFTARCTRCHSDLWGGERGPHNNKHQEMGFNCTRCHRGLVHDPKLNQAPPSREVCLACHGVEQP